MIAQNRPDLNPAQEEAVQASNRPLLIVAGAGTGKTRTLTMRILHFLNNNIPSGSICALTFTNKAAREIEERVLHSHAANQAAARAKEAGQGQLLGVTGGGKAEWPAGVPFLGTFHSFGARIMRKEARLFGRTPDFVIFDSADSLAVVKKVMKALGLAEAKKIRGKDRGPAYFADKISKIKNGMASPKAMLDSGDPEEELVAKIFVEYEKELEKNNAFDFDDLIEKVVAVFGKHPDVLAKYQRRYSHFLVDEYQDVNDMQHKLVRLLAAPTSNLSVVGDDQQCLPPATLIQTPNGPKAIHEIQAGERIVSAAGNGNVCSSVVVAVKQFPYDGSLIVIKTKKGKLLKLTPNHIIFLRHKPAEGMYYVYLMFREDKGFRIGIAKSIRKIKNRDTRQIGLIVRSNQEKADKMWILGVCDSRADAQYWEAYYSSRYGVPTMVFDVAGRNMLITQERIDMFYRGIDSRANAQRLMNDLLIYPEYPHWLPQGGIRFDARRIRLRLTLFDDRRKSTKNPWGMSRLSVNTSDLALKEKVVAAGYATRQGKVSDWRFEKTALDYGSLETMVNTFTELDPGLELARSACLTSDKRFMFQPATHARRGMAIATQEKDEIVEDIIEEVSTEHYQGAVYDLDIANTHNYIAEEFVVHNSIYGWRGSNPEVFLNFERDWPNAQVVVLDQNYRSSQNIINAASALVAHNRKQKPKTLWTANATGEKVRLVEAIDDADEAEWVTEEIMSRIRGAGKNDNGFAEKEIDESGAAINPVKNDIGSTAILYRTNAQSRAIEQALLRRNIPYSVYGGLKFYERKEIRDIVAGLRFALNSQDEISKERLEKSLTKTKFRAFAAALADYFAKTVAKQTEDGIADPQPIKNPVEIIKLFLTSMDYFAFIDRNLTNGIERRENIAALIDFAATFEQLSQMIEEISLLQATDAMQQSKKDRERAARRGEHAKQNGPAGTQKGEVVLMTMHLAKGLEFDNVFIVGANEGLLPHSRSIESEAELEEERRLMYVAMTRARKRLAISFYDIPSRFLSEIPEEFVEFKSLTSTDGNFNDLDDEERYISY